MQKPLTITFRHMDSSDAIKDIIQKRVKKLEHFYDHITHCSVSVEAQGNQNRNGFQFITLVEIVVPGKTIVTKSNAEMQHANVDAYAAIRRTFDAAERRLEDYARIQRRDVKKHTRDAGIKSIKTDDDDDIE